MAKKVRHQVGVMISDHFHVWHEFENNHDAVMWMKGANDALAFLDRSLYDCGAPVFVHSAVIVDTEE